MKVYLAHPISGLGYDEVVEYFENSTMRLRLAGYETLHPMTGKSYLRTETQFKAQGYGNPASTNHAIKERDRWMVTQADVVLLDLTGSQVASIGCCMELAWADLLGKHTVVVMEADNVHRHAFVLECADIVFETAGEAYEYLGKLIAGRI